jgi:hypothetical protein
MRTWTTDVVSNTRTMPVYVVLNMRTRPTCVVQNMTIKPMHVVQNMRTGRTYVVKSICQGILSVRTLRETKRISEAVLNWKYTRLCWLLLRFVEGHLEYGNKRSGTLN